MLSKVFRFSQCIAIVWSCQVRDGESSFIPGACRSCDDAVRTTKYYFQQATPSRINRLLLPVKSSPFPWERSLPDNGENEETLLRIHLSVQPDVEIDLALEKVQRFTQSFPFAAVLPVQPLQYLPTHDGGVDVLFLRKKTEEKGSVDGGIRFFVRRDESDDLGGIEIIAKRNSLGQTVGKIFSERLVVQAYVKGVSGEERKLFGAPPDDVVRVSSVFHKWM